MEEKKSIQVELRKLEDMVEKVAVKIHNTVGLLEIIRLGMEKLYREDDNYEISSVCVILEYLSAICQKDITKMNDILLELKGKF